MSRSTRVCSMSCRSMSAMHAVSSTSIWRRATAQARHASSINCLTTGSMWRLLKRFCPMRPLSMRDVSRWRRVSPTSSSCLPAVYSLEDIGRYYADYVRLMSHWHDVFPGRSRSYEEVVDDLLACSSLMPTWALKRPVCVITRKTARCARPSSRSGSRYRDALQLWERYQPHLAPLESILRERGVPL